MLVSHPYPPPPKKKGKKVKEIDYPFSLLSLLVVYKHEHAGRKLLSLEDLDYSNMKSAGYTEEEAMAIRKRQEDAVRAYTYKCAIVGTLCGFLFIFFSNFRIKRDWATTQPSHHVVSLQLAEGAVRSWGQWALECTFWNLYIPIKF